MDARSRPLTSALALTFVALAGCTSPDRWPGRARATSPHARYAAALAAAGLDSTALGRRWSLAAALAIRLPAAITLPYREAGYFGAAEPSAAGWVARVQQGQRLRVVVDVDGATAARLFIEVFEWRDTLTAPRLIASGTDQDGTLELVARERAWYVVRIQPELLRSARFTVDIRAGASLAFPVDGRGSSSVKSFWGAERDGGRRSHQGIDIFAARGTPVLAAADGRITRVHETAIGGRVVWLADAAGRQSIYYAHLDRSLIREGEIVSAGDTVGLVGNTGNARTTSPHLHFGIYRRGEGPVDPFPYVHEPREQAPPISASLGRLGDTLRIARAGLFLDPAGPVLQLNSAIVLAGASGDRYRVSLPDGAARGLVAAAALESLRDPLRQLTVREGTKVRDRPSPGAVAMDSVERDVAANVLASHGRFLLVQLRSGRRGWIDDIANARRQPSPN